MTQSGRISDTTTATWGFRLTTSTVFAVGGRVLGLGRQFIVRQQFLADVGTFRFRSCLLDQKPRISILVLIARQ